MRAARSTLHEIGIMKKREFLKSLAVGAAGLCTGPLAFGAVTPDQSRRPPKNWIGIRAPRSGEAPRTPAEWHRLLETLRAMRIDAVILEVYDGQHAYWDSKVLPVAANVLDTVLAAGHHVNVEIHGSVQTLSCLVPGVLQKHRDWYDVNANGESAADKPPYTASYRFLDPARPEVQQFVQTIVAEICDHPRLAGVCLSDIHEPPVRLPKRLQAKYKVTQDTVDPRFDYGYTKYSREQFKKNHGKDPLSLQDRTENKEWLQYRLDTLTRLVNEHLVPAAHDRGRLISAAVLPGPTLARTEARQDWARWNLDSFLPRLDNDLYETGPEWVKEQTAEGVASAKAPVYGGLSVTDTDAKALAALVRAVLDGGADGVGLFSLDAMNDEKWKALGQAQDAARAPRAG